MLAAAELAFLPWSEPVKTPGTRGHRHRVDRRETPFLNPDRRLRLAISFCEANPVLVADGEPLTDVPGRLEFIDEGHSEVLERDAAAVLVREKLIAA